MSEELNKILNEAVPRWAKLTGTKLGTNKYTFTIGSNSAFQDWDLKKYVDSLNEARTLDMSGVTAILYLRGLFEEYVKERSFSVHTLLYAPKNVEDTVERLKSFHELINLQPCREAADEFRDALRLAATNYGYDVTKLKKHLEDEWMLAELRLAAYRSLENLGTHQFAQGPRGPEPLKYNREIFEFTSVNSFLHAMRHQMVSGITLALIRDTNGEGDVYKSYFVLGIRNGETITVLTDWSEGAHPEYHNMTRRPDKRLDERARQNWFPYRLLDLDPVKHKQLKDKTALVPIEKKATPIEEISNLEPSEFIWLILLFNLIRDKFDRDDYKTPELSYTGEMVVNPHALVDGNSALVLAGHYQPLVLPKLTVETATPELAETNKPLGHNAWLEERYRGRIPEILLDVVGERKALEVGKEAKKLLGGKVDPDDLPRERQQPGVIRWGGYDHRLEPLKPMALDPTYFGTRKDIEKNRAWYARNNLIKGVQRLATAEFAAKQEMILSWYRKRIERNMDFIWRAVAAGELVAPVTIYKSRDHATGRGAPDHDPFPREDELRWKTANVLSQKQANKYNPFYTRGGVTFGGWDKNKNYNICAIDPPTRATIFTHIKPDNPRTLALLMGIPETKIPWPLQHWTTHEPYTGNSILDRVDPQDSRLDDPWRHLDLGLQITLSKRAYNNLRKQYGLGPKEVQKEKEAG